MSKQIGKLIFTAVFLFSLILPNLTSVSTAVNDFTYNGIRYFNPFNPYGPPLPNGSPNLPVDYTGAYNPYYNYSPQQVPGTTIIYPNYAYPVIVPSYGFYQPNTGFNTYRRPCRR